MILTSASASAGVKTTDWELALPRGEIAPFDGVLVPEDAYRFYQTDSQIYKGCEERLKASVGLCEAAEESWFTSRQLMFFAFGAAAAFAYAAEHR